MAESWLCVSGAGAAEEAGPEGGLEECNTLNDNLTSLQWLQEFSILNAKAPALPSGDTDPHGSHELAGSAEPVSPLAVDPACLGQLHTPGKPTSSCTPRSAPSGLQALPPNDEDYATNPHVKPPYSYATLICMAMQASKATKIILSAIYNWITDNFCYFHHADPTWQNSIRHNLSLYKVFIKVPREKDEPRKGVFWSIDPQYAEQLLSGALKKRRLPPVHIHPAIALQAAPEPSAALWAGPLTVNTEVLQVLREFEEATGEAGWVAGEGRLGRKHKQPLPKQVAKVPRPSSPLLLTQEEQGELEPLKGNFDWEAILDAGTLDGELGTLETLELNPPLSPTSHGDVDLTIHGHHIDCPVTWGTPVEHATDSLDFDETFLATSYLQHPWRREPVAPCPPRPSFRPGMPHWPLTCMTGRA